NVLADAHSDAARDDVGVAGVGAIRMLDRDVVTPAAVPSRVNDGALVSGVDGRVAGGAEVDAGVQHPDARDRVDAHPVTGADVAGGGACPALRAHFAACTRAPLLFEALLVVGLGGFTLTGEE